MNGSQRDGRTDYVLPADIVAGWGAARGAKDPARDLIAEFQGAGYTYAPDKAGLDAGGGADKLLGLFALLEHERRVRQDRQASRHLDRGRRLRLPRPADARRDGLAASRCWRRTRRASSR